MKGSPQLTQLVADLDRRHRLQQSHLYPPEVQVRLQLSEKPPLSQRSPNAQTCTWPAALHHMKPLFS